METEALEPRPTSPPGFGPTPDPTRSGALWVGGAGVALLLAAAAVLTAVRWDDIAQSAKLGGLVAITLGLLAAGQRFKNSIPMTAQAIFHLGALLIPFDMAAVAILAGRSWQETLLLTAVTSVGAWYGIDRAVPSQVLKWSARAGVIVGAAGVAAVSPIAMPLALATAAVVALVARKPIAAGGWALIASVLPLAAFVPWPNRIAGAMTDLGFETLDRWQPLAAGIGATAVLIGVARLVPRVEVAWAAVTSAALTAITAFALFADAQVNFLSIGALFVGLELVALFTDRDPLWKPIVGLLTGAAEGIAGVVTVVLLTAAIDSSGYNFDPSPTTIGITGLLVALGWLTADRRRLDDSIDWLSALLVGSDWSPTTVMFPAAALAAAIGLGAPTFVVSLVAVALAYWMVATWRQGGAYGAVALVGLSTLVALQTAPFTQLALALVGGAVLMLAANLRVRRNDDVGAMLAALAAMLFLLVGSTAAVDTADGNWPLLLVIAAAWCSSWICEKRPRTAPSEADKERKHQPGDTWARSYQRGLQTRGRDRHVHPADWVGRLTAGVVLISSLWVAPALGIALCLTFAALAVVDYLVLQRAGVGEGAPALVAYALAAGAAVGLAGVPIVELAGLSMATGGASLAIAGFILAGIALVGPRQLELPLAAAVVVTSLAGLVTAVGDTSMFAAALMAVGCTTMFVGAALRDVTFAIAGYGAVALALALQLAAWEVTWLEAYLAMPAIAALVAGWHFHRTGTSSWATFAPTIALFAYVAIADRFNGGSAWHAVIAGAVGVLAVIGGGYRRLVGPLVTGSAVLAIVVGYESLGPAALVPTWAWLAAGGTVLLGAGVAMERSDTTPLERGQQIRSVIATQFS